MRHRVRPEDQPIDHAERRRGHADSQRERDRHERGESERAAQAPDRVADVVDEIRQPMNATQVPHLLFPLLQSVHRAHRGVARLFGGKPVRDAFLDFVLQVEPQLFIELPLHAATAQNGAQPQGRREPPVLYPHNSTYVSAYVSESWMTCEMAVESRCQFAASDSSCFLPRRVSE